MAKISSMKMGEAVASHPNISVKTSLFGLKKDFVYTPTGNKLKGYELNIKGDGCRIAHNLMTAKTAQDLDTMIEKWERLIGNPNGNERLDIALSADKQFVALQHFRYENYLFVELGEPRFFEGEDAFKVTKLLDV